MWLDSELKYLECVYQEFKRLMYVSEIYRYKVGVIIRTPRVVARSGFKSEDISRNIKY